MVKRKREWKKRRDVAVYLSTHDQSAHYSEREMKGRETVKCKSILSYVNILYDGRIIHSESTHDYELNGDVI